MKKLIYILFAMMLFMTVSCVRDAFEEPADTAGNIVLSSSSSRVITKAGLQFVDFPAGTIYQLYAVPSTDLPENYDWSRALLYNTTGIEEMNHTINYGTPIPYRINESLDFYGVTANRKGRVLDVASEDGNSSARDARVAPIFDVRRDNHDAAATELNCHTMPDLMCSNNLKERDSKHGVLHMEFIHTMSKLTFLISREAGAFSLPEMQPVLTGIEIIGGTWTKGMYNLVNDSWSLDDSDKCSPDQSSRYFAGELEIGENVVNVPFSVDGTDASHEMLIIPNADGLDEAYASPRTSEPLKIKISYRIGTEDKTHIVDIMKAVANTDGTVSTVNYNFLKNHHYHLGITLLNDGIQVFAIRPMMYDWIDRDMVNGSEVVLGQPVTFGGVMWMDRNIGATTPDAINDFYHSIGFYYQFGRNIPYILDIDKWVAYVNDDNVNQMTFNNKQGPLVMFQDIYDGANDGIQKGEDKLCVHQRRNNAYVTNTFKKPFELWDQDYPLDLFYRSGLYTDQDDVVYYKNSKNRSLDSEEKNYLYKCIYECMYTYNHKGDKVYGFTHRKSLQEQARFPGDVVTGTNPYQFVSQRTSAGELYYTNNAASVAGTPFDRTGLKCENWLEAAEEKLSNDLWALSDNHPCPKGWRLPTYQDLYAFMPEKEKTRLDWTHSFYPKAENTNYYTYPERNEEARYGKVTINGEVCQVMYMLKNKGTTDAYRVMIRSHEAAAWEWSNAKLDGIANKGYHNPARKSSNKHAISISHFPAEPDKTIDDYVGSVEGDDIHLQPGMWDNPSETMTIPSAGYIVSDGIPDLRTFGAGVVMRTSDSVPTPAGTHEDRAKCYALYLSTTNDMVSVSVDHRRSLGDQIRCVRDVEATE